MTSVNEAAASAGTVYADVLSAGVDTISGNQEIVFTQFVRLVLPLDGYVFLVQADLVSSNPIFEAAQAAAAATGLPLSFSAKGSLHYGTVTSQEEAATLTRNDVVFTAEGPVPTLNLANPLVVYLAEFEGVQFGFSSRRQFYRQAGLWHYAGIAVQADMGTQVITDPAQIDTANVIVSNSLPIWLALLTYRPPVALHANPGIVLYPSFLVPRNLAPPYGVVDIDPGRTVSPQSGAGYSSRMTETQLACDAVKVTLFGVRNDAALDFVAWVIQYCLFTGNMGVTNIPVPRDEKRGQVELDAIAMKKTILLDVNYYQTRVNDVARQLIKTALPVNYQPQSL